MINQLRNIIKTYIIFLSLIILLTACKKEIGINPDGWETGEVTDFDGNTYNTIKIGNQWWMAENLNTKHYSNGSEILLVDSKSDWNNLGILDRAYCYYNNSADNGNIYGALYTWSAAMNNQSSSISNPSGVQGVCPTGWHMPSDAEWKELELYLGMSQSEVDKTEWRGTNEGSKLAGNADIWNNDVLENDPTFGTSGFSALPGNHRFPDGKFTNLNHAGFWSATETDNNYAWFRELGYCNEGNLENITKVRRNGYGYKTSGSSVRCIKD